MPAPTPQSILANEFKTKETSHFIICSYHLGLTAFFPPPPPTRPPTSLAELVRLREYQKCKRLNCKRETWCTYPSNKRCFNKGKLCILYQALLVLWQLPITYAVPTLQFSTVCTESMVCSFKGYGPFSITVISPHDVRSVTMGNNRLWCHQ